MFASKDLSGEVRKLEEKISKGEVSSADVVKALVLLIKVVKDVRTNQVTTMKHNKVPLRQVKADTSKPEQKK